MRYLHWDSRALKMIYCVCIQYKEDNIFIDVVFGESFSSVLAYTSRPYSEAMVMRPAVTYTLYDTSLREQTGDVITFAQFEEGNTLNKTRNNAESGEESDKE